MGEVVVSLLVLVEGSSESVTIVFVIVEVVVVVDRDRWRWWRWVRQVARRRLGVAQRRRISLSYPVLVAP